MTSQSASGTPTRRMAGQTRNLIGLGHFLVLPFACSAHSGEAATPSTERVAQETRREAEEPDQGLNSVESSPEPLSFARGHSYLVSSRKLKGKWPAVVPKNRLASWRLPLDATENNWLILDGHPARYAHGRSLGLPDLLNEDEELAPGFHWLSVILVDRENEEAPTLEVSLQAIAVEEEPAGLPRAPGCALLWPVGTYNGSQASEEIEVLGLARQGEVDRIVYEARADEWLMRGSADWGSSLTMVGAPSGDIEVTATCYVGDEALPSVTQTITVNREAPEQERAP